MIGLFPRWVLAVAFALVVPAVLASDSAALWATTLVTLPVAFWLLGDAQTYRVLPWIIAVNWLADPWRPSIRRPDRLVFSLSGWAGPYQVEAIVFSLCAVLALSLGMRWGTQLSKRMYFGRRLRSTAVLFNGNEGDIGLQRAVIWYFLSLPVTSIFGIVSASVPIIAQPFYAMTLIKFVCVYLVAAKVFETGRGYLWIALVAVLEMIIGLTGYFSSYKEGIIVMLIALAASQRRINARKLILRRGSHSSGCLGFFSLDCRQNGVSRPHCMAAHGAAA